MYGKWSCFRECAADPASFQVLPLLVLGWRLLIYAGSTVPVIAGGDPSSERGQDKHPDELLQSHGAALVILIRVQASNRARVRVISALVTGGILLNQDGSTVPAIMKDGLSTERGRDTHPDEQLQSRGAALVSWYERRQVTVRESGCFQLLSRAVYS